MYPELETIIHQAEAKYLQDEDLKTFSSHIDHLKEKVEIYELVRENEVAVFQAVADKLLETFPEEKPARIEKSLKQWLLITRYCSMAMLLNNSEFLDRHLLEWLTDIVIAHDLQDLENKLIEFLSNQLTKVLSETQLSYLQPFLMQAQNTLLGN